MEKKTNNPAITKSYAKKMETNQPVRAEKQTDRYGRRKYQENSTYHAECGKR